MATSLLNAEHALDPKRATKVPMFLGHRAKQHRVGAGDHAVPLGRQAEGRFVVGDGALLVGLELVAILKGVPNPTRIPFLEGRALLGQKVKQVVKRRAGLLQARPIDDAHELAATLLVDDDVLGAQVAVARDQR